MQNGVGECECESYLTLFLSILDILSILGILLINTNLPFLLEQNHAADPAHMSIQ